MTSFAVLAVAVHLVLVHRPEGGEVMINPTHVIALHAATPGQPNRFVTGAAHCVISTGGGKFIAVVETCEAVKRLLEEAQ